MSYSRRGSFVQAVLGMGLIYTYWQYAQYVLLGLVILFISKRVYSFIRYIRSVVQNSRLKSVDTMSGIDFEYYIAEVLQNTGYYNVTLTEQFDYGVDIIAEKDGIRWGIQVKRYSGLVKAAAVRQVVTGLRIYNCDRAMVITNSIFSNVARRLAAGNDCVLVDRAGLYQLTH